jgi:hypothetical protein
MTSNRNHSADYEFQSKAGASFSRAPRQGDEAAYGARFAWLARLRQLTEMGRLRQLLEQGSVDKTVRLKLDEIAAFVGRLAIGSATPADWGRLERMYQALHGDQPLRAIVIESIEHARQWPDLADAAINLRSTLTDKVGPRFAKLDLAMIRDELANLKKGPVAVAAALSSACGEFGDSPTPRDRTSSGSVRDKAGHQKSVGRRYQSAWERLKVPPTK